MSGEKVALVTGATKGIGRAVADGLADPATGKATGVNIIDHNTKEGRTYSARVVFLCASALASNHILLNSRSEANPTGLGNSSGMLGHYITDHFGWAGANGAISGA